MTGLDADRRIRRVGLVSMHTSPLAQPGDGDAGGLNTYVTQTARHLAARGIEVEILTRATRSDQPCAASIAPGVLVRHVPAGPFEALDKRDLPGQLCTFAAGAVRLATGRERPGYDVVHTHYWLSGLAGEQLRARWGIPLVHSPHTLAAVKNAALPEPDTSDADDRVLGERRVARAADRLVANTVDEARALVETYGADPSAVDVVPPGVDTMVFTPGDRAAARAALGIGTDEHVVAFAGRIQPLKAPEVLVRALARMVARYPGRRWRLLVIGGASGTAPGRRHRLADLAAGLGVGDLIDFRPAMPARDLARAFRAADVVAVPSRHESFGLVALEAQACGVPVVAAAVGGLPIAVADRRSGLLVPGHDPAIWADRLAEVLLDPARGARLGAQATVHAGRFSWSATTDALLDAYHRALAGVRTPVAAAAS